MKNRKLSLIGISTFISGIVAMFMVIAVNANNRFTYLSGVNESTYSLTLNSTNKVTSAGDKDMYTALNNKVTFTYSGVQASTSGHATLNANGIIVNKDHIRSIENITCTFSAASTAPTFEVSYGGDVWNTPTTMTSGYRYNLGTNPYYVRITAKSITTITELKIGFSCVVNSAAHEGETGGEDVNFYQKVTSSTDFGAGTYLIVYEDGQDATIFDSSLTTIDATNNNISAEITSNDTSNYVIEPTSEINSAAFTIATMTGGYSIKTSRNTFIANKDANNSLIGSDSAIANSITIEDGEAEIICSNGGSSLYLRYNANSDQQRFRYFKASSYSNQQPISLYKYVTVQGAIHYDTPENEIIGFSAVDSKAASYYTVDTYDTVNGLTVTANKMGGTTVPLAKGGADGYSYVIKNSSNAAINTAQPFGEEGVYTLIVSYKEFIPVEIQLTVGFKVALTGISVNSSTLTFNTAQKLSDYTSGITADLTYNKPSENENGVSYSEFASKGLTLTLSNPSSVVTPITNLFGVAGTWVIKVASNENPSVYGTLNITVNAIPVTSIVVSGPNNTATVEEGSTLQLTATVSPNNATNGSVTWESNHTNIATVDNSGLVTGVSAGEAVITATAVDGSAVYGSITITVTEKITGQDEGTFTLSTGSLTVGSYIIFANQTTDGNGYAMGSQNTNNRTANTASFDNGTIERDSNSPYRAFLVREGLTSGTYSFYDETDDGYLYAASSSSNYLRTETTLSANSSFTVSGSQEKSVVAQGSNTHNLLRFNLNSKIFSCYASNQSNPYIYEKAGEPVYPTSISVSGTASIGVGETSQLTVTYNPTDTTVKSVSYESSNDLVATVSDEGLVTGIKAGSATITVTGHGGISTSINITVSNIAVSSVSLNKSSTSIVAGSTETLVATISPSNATNKELTWSTSDNSVATVSDGVVTAKGKGTATITVTTADGGKTALCTVTVTANTETATTYNFTSKSWEATEGNWTSGQDGAGFLNSGVQVTSGASGANATSPDTFSNVQSIVVRYCTNASKGAGSIALEVGDSTFASQQSVTTSGGTTGRDMTFTGDGTLSGNVKITVTCTTNSIYILSVTINAGTPEPTDPTGISVSPSSCEVSPGGTKTLSVTYTPTSANQNKAITWSSNNTSVATVDTSGKVTVASGATVGATATITAKLTNLPSIPASTCVVTVVESAKADHTVLVYICGSNLESDSGLATGDIQEILSVSGQPDDVNIVIETGGATKWKSTYGISNTYLQRRHVKNRSLVLDDSLEYAGMGKSSTLQSFIEYGLENYPAERTGLILWNHGGAMHGVCYDDKDGSDALLNSEVKTAVTNALNNKGSNGQKLEWIGYDACLMQVQDIAEFNSQYTNYMIASEESESGYGWDYDTWVDDLYAKKTTQNILKAVVDGFISSNGGTNSTSNDQTLSYLDLSYMAAYKSAWETMASTINSLISSYGETSFQTLMKSCKYYGSDSDCEGYSYFGIFDAKDVLNKLSSTSAFNSASTQINNAKTAFGNLVAYSSCGRGAGNSYGLCCYFPMTDGSGYNCGTSTYYTTSQTTFTNWRSIVTSYGNK